MKAIKSNLRDGERERMLCCRECLQMYSADKLDYFWMVEDDVLICCGHPLTIVTTSTIIEEVHA